jgi:hypothetical protein
MPGRPSGETEDDEDDEDVPVETESGAANGAQGSDLGELLLDLTVALIKASILLSEADRSAWDDLAPRLRSLHAAIGAVPTDPPPARRVGFVAPTPADPPSRGRTPARSRRPKRKA